MAVLPALSLLVVLSMDDESQYHLVEDGEDKKMKVDLNSLVSAL